MFRAILFDFNGVIVDDEFLHCELFQKALAEIGVNLTKEEYYRDYLGYDDHDAFSSVLARDHKKFSEIELQKLVDRKNIWYDEAIATQDLFLPGVIDFIQKVSQKYFLGIVSGALKREILAWLERKSLTDYFQTIIGAEEVEKGKPDPEGYLKALDHLNRDCVASSEILIPQECLVIEDSMWGIEAAQAAGMKCLGITTSYSKNQLHQADAVFDSFQNFNWKLLI